jgi:hypothetical protein
MGVHFNGIFPGVAGFGGRSRSILGTVPNRPPGNLTPFISGRLTLVGANAEDLWG